MEIETTTVAVTVYPNRARVTRRGVVTLKPGGHKLTVGELPLSLMTDSVRASGQGTARVQLKGVDVQRQHYTETPADRVRDLQSQIRSTEDQITRLNRRYDALEVERTQLEHLGTQGETIARGLFLRNVSAQQVGSVFDFLRQRTQEISDAELAIEQERRTLKRDLDYLIRQRDELTSAKPKERMQATVEVEALSEGEFTLELTYVVNGARWSPLYDLRLGPDGLLVEYLAEVTQKTGETWQNVALVLSTAMTTTTLEIPELRPWYVTTPPPMLRPASMPAAPPQAKRAGGAMRAMAAMPMAEADEGAYLMADAELEPIAMEVTEATVSESGAALTYTLQGGHDIPGGGDPRKVVVASFRLPVKIDHVIAPKTALAAYRRAKVKNESAYTLLPGTAQLFENDEYLGKISIQQTAPNGELVLALGLDERLKVERKLTAREVDKNFMGDRRRTRYAYEITVTNTREAALPIEVRDQIPVSQHESIKVELKGASPKPGEQTRLNELIWKVDAPAGGKQVFTFEFTVEHPRELVVRGLGE